MDQELKEKDQQELERLRLYYNTILSMLEPGVIVLDPEDRIVNENEKAARLWNLSGKMIGNKLQETELWNRCPDFKQHLNESRNNGNKPVCFDCYATGSILVTVTITPITTERSGLVGTLIYMEDVTSRMTLPSKIEELENTTDGLQSANEAMERTIEGLQSANEALETTNEELQSLNKELETTNEEISSRTGELDEVNARYSEIMEQMPWPVLLVNAEMLIYMFNSAAQKLFGFAKPSDKGMKLKELPLNKSARQAMLRQHRSVINTRKQSSIRNCSLVTNEFNGRADVHFTPLSIDSAHGVFVVFQVKPQSNGAKRGNNSSAKAAPKNAAKKKLGKKK